MQRRDLLTSFCTTLGAAALLAACGDKKPEAAAAPPAAPPPTGPVPPEKAYEIAAQGTGFTVGAVMAANTVYVFFDTTCPHCAHLWSASKPLLTKLKMKWMPIGLLRAQSEPQGATILIAADPAVAMEENESKVLANTGGITAAATIPDDIRAKVKANTDLFRSVGADSVPFFAWKHAKTGAFGSHAGAVDTGMLAEMIGL